MACYDHLPIWKDAVSLAVLLEEAVRRFLRYHQYALGADLLPQAYAVCRGVAVAEDGYLKRALQRRVLHEIGWAAQPAHLKFAPTPSLGACYAP